MKLLAPQGFPFDFEEWKQKPFPIRVKMLCQAWAMQGYGAPVSVYVFYILKKEASHLLGVFFPIIFYQDQSIIGNQAFAYMNVSM